MASTLPFLIAWPRHELSPGLLLRLTVLLRSQREGQNVLLVNLRRDYRPNLRREPGDLPSLLALARSLPFLSSGNIVHNPVQLAKLLLQLRDLSFSLAELLLLVSKLLRRLHVVSSALSLSLSSLSLSRARTRNCCLDFLCPWKL